MLCPRNRAMRARPLRLLTAAATILLFGAGAQAAFIYDANAALTITHGGDRELTEIRFAGSPSIMDGSNFLRFGDGFLYRTEAGGGAGLYGWTAEIKRDMSAKASANIYLFNPDRADKSTPFSGEANATGRLNEAFGPFGATGYKNMSWILDGEDDIAGSSCYVDLYFTQMMIGGTPYQYYLTGDEYANTVEVALLERGGNSDMRVWGITSRGTGTTLATYHPTLTADSVFVQRQAARTVTSLWSLDTLEIGSGNAPQPVCGYGISIDPTWQNLIGLRIEVPDMVAYSGPDLVAVGVNVSLTQIPEPTTLALWALAGGALLGRLRSRRPASGRRL